MAPRIQFWTDRFAACCDCHHYNRGLDYCKKGEFDRAISDYTEAIRIYPKYSDASQKQCAELLTRDDKIFRAQAKLASMKLDVRYPSDTAQLPDRFRQDDFDGIADFAD